MSLKDKIQKIIDVINNSDIEEIEISSFWGAQKIRLSKSSKSREQKPIIVEKPVENKDITTHSIINEDTGINNIPASDSSIQESEDVTNNLDENKIVDNQKDNIIDDDLEYQKAPLVGTFYLSSKPGEPPFVSVGDTVSKGQTLCIIEAMKIFNEIESDFNGEVIEIMVNDESPVEFNQSIFSIKPN